MDARLYVNKDKCLPSRCGQMMEFLSGWAVSEPAGNVSVQQQSYARTDFSLVALDWKGQTCCRAFEQPCESSVSGLGNQSGELKPSAEKVQKPLVGGNGNYQQVGRGEVRMSFC